MNSESIDWAAVRAAVKKAHEASDELRDLLEPVSRQIPRLGMKPLMEMSLSEIVRLGVLLTRDRFED
ncbi:MAG: hypothetical protein AAF589_09345 [Planctomycetota bacterium]